MKAVYCGIFLGLLCSCAAPPPVTDERKIQGFGSIRLGQTLPEAKSSLDRVGLYYSFTGRALDYETTVNGDRWYVSAQIIKTRIAAITVTARPIVAGGPAAILSETECNRRVEKTLDALRREYGDESTPPLPDSADTADYLWIERDRSIAFHRHKVEAGCDGLSIAFTDFSIADHF